MIFQDYMAKEEKKDNSAAERKTREDI